mmetsp:Transcript_39459/g.65579  ORF Transcript_39459/g.65579 Transcript_39459/m.65579 type:complete len:203 (-) Transcript_39459:1934-2542(-)
MGSATSLLLDSDASSFVISLDSLRLIWLKDNWSCPLEMGVSRPEAGRPAKPLAPFSGGGCECRRLSSAPIASFRYSRACVCIIVIPVRSEASARTSSCRESSLRPSTTRTMSCTVSSPHVRLNVSRACCSRDSSCCCSFRWMRCAVRTPDSINWACTRSSWPRRACRSVCSRSIRELYSVLICAKLSIVSTRYVSLCSRYSA